MSEVKTKLVIFDLDGTLVDAYKAVSESLNFALESMSLPRLDDETIKRSVGWGEHHLISKFVPKKFVEKTLIIYRKHHRQALKRGTKFLPFAKQTITGLHRRGVKLAIASNRPTLYTRIILKQLKVIELFKVVLCADKVKRGKPAPDLLIEILKKMNLKVDQVMYIGDMAIDVEAGFHAKIRTVAVLTGSSNRSEIKALRPFKMIKNLKSLSAILV